MPNTDERRAKKLIFERFGEPNTEEWMKRFERDWAEFLKAGHKSQTPEGIAAEYVTFAIDSANKKLLKMGLKPEAVFF